MRQVRGQSGSIMGQAVGETIIDSRRENEVHLSQRHVRPSDCTLSLQVWQSFLHSVPMSSSSSKVARGRRSRFSTAMSAASATADGVPTESAAKTCEHDKCNNHGLQQVSGSRKLERIAL